MKLLFAIVDREDANAVVRNLSHRGFSSTKLATTGGFLLSNNITLLVGVEDKMPLSPVAQMSLVCPRG